MLVLTKSGEKAGTVVERWNSPLSGNSYVVAIGPGFMVIAPVQHVRRSSESEDT